MSLNIYQIFLFSKASSLGTQVNNNWKKHKN